MTSQQRQDLIAKVNQIEGLSTEERSALLELLRSHKKYGLVWENNPEDVEEQLRDHIPVLTEVKECAITNNDYVVHNLIFIECSNITLDEPFNQEYSYESVSGHHHANSSLIRCSSLLLYPLNQFKLTNHFFT